MEGLPLFSNAQYCLLKANLICSSLLLKCYTLCFQLEKEALVKGVPVGQAIDIEIPPPRPKRKPSNPYPRKTGTVSSPNTQDRAKDGKQASSSSSEKAKQALDLEKAPLPEVCNYTIMITDKLVIFTFDFNSVNIFGLQKCAGDNRKSNGKETCGDGPYGKCSEAFKLFQEGMSTLAASANDNSVTALDIASQSCNFKEFVPLKKRMVNNGNADSHATDGSNTIDEPDKTRNAETVQNDTGAVPNSSHLIHEKSDEYWGKNEI